MILFRDVCRLILDRKIWKKSGPLGVLCTNQLETSTSPRPTPRKPEHLNFQILDRSNSRPLERKWCSNGLLYRRICLSNAPL